MLVLGSLCLILGNWFVLCKVKKYMYFIKCLCSVVHRKFLRAFLVRCEININFELSNK